MSEITEFKDEQDRQQFDALRLKDKDPSKHYRFARKRDINVARHAFNGYEVVDKTTDKVRSILDDTTKMKKGEDTSTSIEVADAILMSIPKEKHEQIMRERQRKIENTTRGVSQTFKNASTPRAAIAYEENADNPNMSRGMSEKAFEKLLEEQRHEEARKRR